jgi:Tfp pilus assembly protein PilO
MKNKALSFILIIAAAVISVYLYVTGIIMPFSSRWREQSARINSKKALLNKDIKLIEDSRELNGLFEKLSQNIRDRLPLDRKEGEFLTEIDRVAQDTNVRIKSMNPRPAKDLGPFKELSVEIDMEANLGNLIRFLYNMREASVVLVANRIKLEPKSQRSALIEGDLVISSIFLKE